MKFVNMHKVLIWFPAVGTCIKTIPSNKELHGRSLMMISTMIMNVRLDLLASNQIINAVYRLLMSYHLYVWEETCYYDPLEVYTKHMS